MIDKFIFSQRFKELRQENGKTMVDVANALGIKKNSVFTWENQKTLPSADHLVSLAEMFQCSIDYLIGRTENREVNR